MNSRLFASESDTHPHERSIRSKCRRDKVRANPARTTLLALAVAAIGFNQQLACATNASVFGVFVGSSPCGEPIRQLLRLPSSAECELIQWQLTLYQEPKTLAPSRYELRCEYGLTKAGHPGLAKGIKTLQQQGTWGFGKGTKSNPDALVADLLGAFPLIQVDSNILHVLNPDRSLMVGNGGWSFTLNRTEHAEKSVTPAMARSQPSMSYQISPLATGPSVFGVFEGRTPAQGIARELKIPMHAGGNKAKWRVTLYQNPETHAPTTYKVEGSLYRKGARAGDWSIVRGHRNDPHAMIYRLAATNDEPPLLLLKGDDNVLFFLDQNSNLLVGHEEFSYTLNRKSAFEPAVQTGAQSRSPRAN